jgi:hypothetical protein
VDSKYRNRRAGTIRLASGLLLVYTQRMRRENRTLIITRYRYLSESGQP